MYKAVKNNPLAAAGIATGAYLVVSNIIKTFLHKNDRQADTVIDELAAAKKAGQVPTLAKSEALGFADALYHAGSGESLFGTDEDAMYNVFKKVKNKADVLLIIKEFGSRRLWFSFVSSGLSGYLNDELNPSELAVLNSILRAKKIAYQF
tara:strand:+ start:6396 stop:6845 length:450 start_codon:yes stop_codon:yes gene_type:complete